MTVLSLGRKGRKKLSLVSGRLLWTGRDAVSLARGGGGAGAPPVDLTAAGGSLRFPEENLQTTEATQAAALLQAGTGTGAGFFTNDSAVFAIVRLPRVRRNDNLAFAVFGHNVTTARRWFFRYYGELFNNASFANRVQGFFRAATGSSTDLLSAPWTEDAALFVLKKVGNTTAATWSMDWYSLLDGTKYAGATTAAGALPGLTTFASDWLVGHFGIANPTLTATPAGGSGPWAGEIQAIGYLDVTSADADWQAIALGADPITQFGSANLKYYRKFDGTSASYAPASSGDTMASLTAWTGGNLSVGSHFRRKSSANYVTFDSLQTGHVFGLLPGQSSRSCTFSGKAGGYTGNVEIRVFRADTGAVVLDWTSVGAISAGAWSGSVTLPKSSSWLLAQARPASTPADVTDMREQFGVGYKFLLLGQSQMTILRNASNASFNTFDRPFRLSVLDVDQDATSPPVTLRRYGYAKKSDGFAYFEKMLGAFDTTTPVQIVLDAKQGTGMDDLMSDTLSSRLWTYLQNKLDKGGNDISAVIHQWITNDAGVNYVPRLEALYNNTGAAVSDHSLATALGAGFGVAYSPGTRHSVSTGVVSSRTDGVTYALAEGWTVGPWVSDMQIEDAGGPHQKPNVLKGNPLLGTRLALAAAKAMSLTSVTYPTFAGTATRLAGTLTIPVTMANGGTLYSPNSADVRSFEVDDGGVGSWSATGFTAAVSGNNVVITKSAGNWSPGTKVRYVSSLAFRANGDGAAETAIIDGALYETWASDPLGLGLPVTPLLAETVAT